MERKIFKRLHRGTVQIELDLLKRDIMDYGKRKGKYTDWLTYLGIFLSCLLNFLVSDFKDAFGIQAEQWKIIVALIMILTAGMTIYQMVKNFINTEEKCINSTMIQVKRDACNPNEDRILFIVLKYDAEGKPQLLVYRDLIWECWFLPNLRYENLNENSIKAYRSYIAQEIGLPISAVQLELFPDKDDCCTRKMSLNYLEVTDYYTKFCFVKISAVAEVLEKLREPTFEHSGRQFRWMSITKMLADQDVLERNGDIVHFLQDHYETFFYNRKSIEER